MTLKTLLNKFLSFFRKVQPEERNSSLKLSLHIGINDYPGSQNDLKGCVNDANAWEELLRETYGFKTKKLLDKQATYKNVVREMKKLIAQATKDSHIAITDSSHGSNIRDISGDEPDRRDECLCLYDKFLIDDEIKTILDKLPEGASLTFISDSCHSGTVTRSFLSAVNTEDYCKPRYLPPEDNEESVEAVPRAVVSKIFTPKNQNHVLISGCADHEYSYDARFGGKPFGAMTYNAVDILKKNPNCTYSELYKLLRKRLPSGQYPQTPQLTISDKYKNMKVFS